MEHASACVIRDMKEREYPLLEEFLYEAIYIPEGTEPPPRSVIDCPELQIFISEFGQWAHDKAIAAEVDGKIVGVVWVRIAEGYGHIDNETPSFAVSLYPAYRGKGIGTALMRAMIDYLRRQGYKQGSLSVQKENYALKMYRKLGFETTGENEEEYIMVIRFQ